MKVHHIHRTQRLPIPVDVAWAFLANPANLALITPAHFELRDISPTLTREVFPGYVYVLTMKAMGLVPVTWLGEITLVERNRRYIDQQRIGPFRFWHHEHRLHPIDDGEGVEITDSLHYAMPFGWLGELGHALLMERQMHEMFDYRMRMLEEYFGGMAPPSTYRHVQRRPG